MSNLRSLCILGYGGHAKAIYSIAKELNKWKNIFFLDDNVKKNNNVKGKLKLINNYIKRKDLDFIIGIGDNKIRKNIFEKYFKKNNKKLVTLIHPTSFISRSSKIKNGTVIFANCVISNDCSIGFCSIINNLSSIDHDCNFSNFVHISPGVNIAGYVKLGQMAWIGIGSKIINNLKIGSNSIVGAGSIILSDVKTNSLVHGIYKL